MQRNSNRLKAMRFAAAVGALAAAAHLTAQPTPPVGVPPPSSADLAREFRSEFADLAYTRCREIVLELRTADPSFAELARMELTMGRLYAIGQGTTDLDLARDHLGGFAPGGAHAETPWAEQGRELLRGVALAAGDEPDPGNRYAPGPASLLHFYKSVQSGDFNETRRVVTELRRADPDKGAPALLEYLAGELFFRGVSPPRIDYTLDHTSQFLPGAPHAESRLAAPARFLYARAALYAGRSEEAAEILRDLMTSDDLESVVAVAEQLLHLCREAGDRAGAAQCRQEVQRAVSANPDHRLRPWGELLLGLGDTQYAALAEGRYQVWRADKAERMNRRVEARAAWKEVEKSLTAARATLPPMSPPGATEPDPDLGKKIIARFYLGRAKFALGDFAGALALMEEVRAYSEDDRLIDRPGFRDLHRAMMWSAAARMQLGEDPAQIEDRIIEYLATGNCSAAQVVWAYTALADLAGRRGDPLGQYVAYKEALELLNMPWALRGPRRALARLDATDPALKEQAEGKHTRALDAMQQASVLAPVGSGNSVATRGGATTGTEGPIGRIKTIDARVLADMLSGRSKIAPEFSYAMKTRHSP